MLRRLVENADPGVVRPLPDFGRRTARYGDGARSRQAPEIVQSRGEHSHAVSPENINPTTCAAANWPLNPTRSKRHVAGSFNRPEPVMIKVRRSNVSSKTEMREETIAREHR